jgi:hypothetical protein
VLLRVEPIKQRTRRPERRGITQAVSPKKIGERKKRMSKLKNVGEKGARRADQPGVLALEIADDGARGPFPAITSGLATNGQCPRKMPISVRSRKVEHMTE